MSIYLNAASRLRNNASFKTIQVFDRTISVPYFQAFHSHRVSLAELYSIIDQQIEDCLQQAGWSYDELSDIPIFLGSTSYTIANYEYMKQNNNNIIDKPSLVTIAEYLQQRYHTTVFSFATSCTSSAQAVNYASKMLNNDFYNKALVIGFELFNRLTFEHFYAMNLLAEQPYETQTKVPQGMILGEGVACLALSKQPNSNFSFEILGISSVNDNENLTNISEQALQTLLQQTLLHSNSRANQINTVKMHYVGGPSDLIETNLLTELLPTSKKLAFKTEIGHTLGACAAIETAVLLEKLQQTHSGSKTAHSEKILNYFLGFGGANIGWVVKWTN